MPQADFNMSSFLATLGDNNSNNNSSDNNTETPSNPEGIGDLFDYMNETHPMFGFGLGDVSEKDFLQEDLPNVIKSLFIVTYVGIILLSVLGNTLVILVVVKNQKMRTVTNTFLVSLAVSDLLIACLNMPFQLRFYVQNEWTLGEAMCKFTNYLQGVLIVSSILTLTGIAIDRYYAICHPLRARHVHTITRAAVLITIFWAISFLLLSPQLMVQRIGKRLRIDPDSDVLVKMVDVCVEYFHDHRLNVAFTLFIYIALYLLPVTIIFVTYCTIAHKLWRRRPIGETCDDQRDSDRRLKEKKRIVRMLIVIIVLFAVSWFPFFTCHVYSLFHSHADQNKQWFRVLVACAQLFGYANCCINPIVYCFLNQSFKQHLLKSLCCCKCFWRRLRARRRSSSTDMDRVHAMVSSNSTHHSTV